MRIYAKENETFEKYAKYNVVLKKKIKIGTKSGFYDNVKDFLKAKRYICKRDGILYRNRTFDVYELDGELFAYISKNEDPIRNVIFDVTLSPIEPK